jgi:serine/threonine protein phosphatase PrpC
MKFSVFQTTHQGGRQKNEDRMGYCYTAEAALFLLADGMGGHPEGEMAAHIALQAIATLFQRTARPALEDPAAFFELAIMAAHRQIILYAAEHGLPDSPRTTLVAAVVQNGAATWMHCGDSRLYLVREGALLTRTRDHSYVEQRESGRSLSESPMSYNRNVLYTCLGSPVRPQFDISSVLQLQQGDKILLCSDGLWDSLDEGEIVEHLSQQAINDAVPNLADRALLKAGARSDNVTLLALEWETPDGFDTTRSGAPLTPALAPIQDF